MHINLNKLKTGDKVAFSSKVEKTVCHTCGDNNQIRSVSFTDGTILERDDSLWELAGPGLPGELWSGQLTRNGRYRYCTRWLDYAPEIFLNLLKQDDQTAAIPVVVVSADATPGQIERLIAMGAQAYLTKPLDIKQLMHQIEELLNKELSYGFKQHA
jgi:hypothetical protein